MPQSPLTLADQQTPPRRNPAVSAVQQVYEALRHRIIHFVLPPGTNIAKGELTAEFGVSPTPVREALLRLSDEGLVEIYPQSRTTVSLIDVQHAREVHFLRLSVEVEVVRVLAETITSENLNELDNWIDRQTVELKAGNETAFKIADNNFHEYMFSLAGVHGLAHLIDARRGHYDRIRGLFLQEHGRRETVVDEHLAMIAALKAGDPGAAEAAVRVHLGKSLAIIDEIRDIHPSYFQ